MTDPAALVEPAVGRPISPVALAPIDDPTAVVRAKTERGGAVGIGRRDRGRCRGRARVGLRADPVGVPTPRTWPPRSMTPLGLIVTDTNRDQARHWRGSQDTRGHTEPGGPDTDVLRRTAADQRLPVFADDPDLQTIAVQDGPVRAIASSYGEPFAYRPEDRAVFAVDGDPTTAWRVADHGDPLGERIRLTIVGDDATSSSLRLLQAPTPIGGRSIAAVRVSVDDHVPTDVELDDSSFGRGATARDPPGDGGEHDRRRDHGDRGPARFRSRLRWPASVSPRSTSASARPPSGSVRRSTHWRRWTPRRRWHWCSPGSERTRPILAGRPGAGPAPPVRAPRRPGDGRDRHAAPRPPSRRRRHRRPAGTRRRRHGADRVQQDHRRRRPAGCCRGRWRPDDGLDDAIRRGGRIVAAIRRHRPARRLPRRRPAGGSSSPITAIRVPARRSEPDRGRETVQPPTPRDAAWCRSPRRSPMPPGR